MPEESRITNVYNLFPHWENNLSVNLQHITSLLPMTLLAKEAALSVASPKSPIFTEPVGPVIKMLSHLRSLWMIGGVLVWRK